MTKVLVSKILPKIREKASPISSIDDTDMILHMKSIADTCAKTEKSITDSIGSNTNTAILTTLPLTNTSVMLQSTALKLRPHGDIEMCVYHYYYECGRSP